MAKRIATFVVVLLAIVASGCTVPANPAQPSTPVVIRTDNGRVPPFPPSRVVPPSELLKQLHSQEVR